MPPANPNRVIVHAVIDGGMSAAEAARRFGETRQWVSLLVRRYRAHGEAGLQPRSRRPRSSPSATDEATRARILHLRDTLTGSGLDAGAESIHARLDRERADPPSVSTIWRILKAADAIIPQPQKRPRSSIIRFEAEQPNECWQSDFTHVRLADGTDVEVITWLDDHSRLALHLSAHPRTTGPVVLKTFRAAVAEHGCPAATLTDNAMVYTVRLSAARLRGGRNTFEAELAALGVTQKNSRPNHPT